MVAAQTGPRVPRSQSTFSQLSVRGSSGNTHHFQNTNYHRSAVSVHRPQRPMLHLNPKGTTFQPGPILRPSEPWHDWQELTVRVQNLSPTITTWDLWARFQSEGKIIFIELFENRQGVRDGKAHIRFCPPPHRAFWLDTVTMPTKGEDGAYQVRVEPLPRKRSFQIQSPVRGSRWYPETMTLYPSSIDFGLMLEDVKMMKMFTVHKAPKLGEMSFKVDLLHMRITCSFPVALKDPKSPQSNGQYDRYEKYMFQIPFVQLQKVFRVEIDDKHWAFIIELKNPPQFFRKLVQEQNSHPAEALSWSEFDTWYRQTDILYDPRLLKDAVVSLKRDVAPVIDIGRWTTYRLVFDDCNISDGLYEQVKDALHDFNIDVVRLEMFAIEPARAPKFWSMLHDENPHGTELDIRSMVTEIENSDFKLPFEVQYQLEVCVSQGIFNEYNIHRDFLAQLADLAATDPTKARDILESVAEQESRIYEPSSIFRDHMALDCAIERTIPHYCEFARKVVVTPTTIYLSTPSVETSNRVIRHYSHYSDRFLRVQFTDEKSEGRINSCADKARNDQIFTRIYRTLSNGIRIGGRHYEFLAFGNSQFRENGAYFFCPTEQLSCAEIRAWMGNFSKLRTPAKYAARLGQCFSTTRAIRSTGVQLVEIPDVKRNGYCFTDGVGKISDFLARMIASELGLPSTLPVPSAFQFRLGGCKGILVVSPDARAQEVHIRESQQKFKAIYNGLEIIRCSRYSSASLNRQTITILSSLGVSDEVFTKMLKLQLSNYEQAMKDPRKAQELLGRYIDDNHMTATIAGMIENGFMSTNEPFVLSLLHLWRSWSIKLLKEKARIIVENGAFLLGCTDETGTLHGHQNTANVSGGAAKSEDLPQVFVSVPDKKNPGRYVVIKGMCLLGRNPSLHPGDIRVVQAVDVPALHHLRDVIVFPQQGDRDIPSMCSGGDLDGDDFFVIWDKDLTPKEWNAEPMSYVAPKGEELKRSVGMDDLRAFFVRYMKNDALRTIAYAHLAQSDFLDESVKDRRCLELAELHSKAVDYVKSGVSAEMPKRLKPRKWPHFMEKRHLPKEQVYVSTKILGQLYDLVERIDFVPQYRKSFDHRITKAHDLPNSTLKQARQIKTQYDIAMRRILAQEEVKTEFEIWTAFVLSKPRVGSDYKLQEHIGTISGALKDRFRQICIETAGGRDFKTLAPFVAAMYRVTAEEMRLALYECGLPKIVGGKEVPKRSMDPKSMPLISFPWLFHEILGRIAIGADSSGESSDSGISILSTHHRNNPAGFPTTRWQDPDLDSADFVETAEGITHRGELLDLFRPDHVDSEGDEVEQCYRSRSVPPSADEDVKIHTEDKGISKLDLNRLAMAHAQRVEDDEDDEDDGMEEEVVLREREQESALAQLARMTKHAD